MRRARPRPNMPSGAKFLFSLEDSSTERCNES